MKTIEKNRIFLYRNLKVYRNVRNSIKNFITNVINALNCPSASLWVFFAGVSAILLLPEFTTKGMFFDGLTYASIARNMSEGIGSFWRPEYVPGNVFYQHPPLVHWIQSLFFWMLGDHFFVEKVYSLLTGIITAWLIIILWKKILFIKNQTSFAWAPLFLWVVTPMVYWTYRHNVLENTLTIFCLLAVIFCIYACMYKKQVFLWVFISAFCVFLGILSKGPVALFPLVTIFLYWIVYRDISFGRMVLYTSVYVTFVFLFMFLLLQYGPAYAFLRQYLNEQVIYSIAGKGQTVSILSKFRILQLIFIDNLLTGICISGLIYGIGRWKKIRVSSTYVKASLFLILIGMSASLPLMISSTRLNFYVVPSLPFYALGLAAIIFPIIRKWYESIDIKNMGFKIFKVFSILLFAGGIIFPISIAGKIGRDHDILEDIYILKEHIPKKTILGVSNKMTDHYRLYAYMIRYFYSRFSLENAQSRYVFLEKGVIPTNPNAKRIMKDTGHFDFFIDDSKV